MITTHDERSSQLWQPFFVRLAGLPATLLEELAAPELAARATGLLTRERRGQELRRDLAARLHELVAGAPREHRAFLLAVRRDAFNDRPLRRHRRREGWIRLQAEVPLAAELAVVEDRLERERAELGILYDDERRRQRDVLRRQVQDPSFRRGLALASPDLLRHGLAALAGSARNARALRAQRSLWRYASRAAAKLSPFSTLTVIGLGEVCQSPAAPDLVLHDGWRPGPSTIQVERRLSEAWRDLLLHASPLRERSSVVLNPSVARQPDGSFRLLRPSGWVHESGEIHYRPLAWVRLRFQGAVVDQLSSRLAGGAVASYPEVLAALERDLEIESEDERRQVRELVDALAHAGFLVLRPPFANHQPRLETALLAALSGQHGSAPVAALEELVARERRLAHSPRPEAELAALPRILPAVLAEVCAAAGIPATDGVKGLSTSQAQARLYEDVFVAPADPCSAAVVTISRTVAEDLLRLGNLLLKLMNLYNHRHDLLHTLEAALHERWPHRRQIPAHEVFEAFQELWKRYLEFDAEQRHSLLGTFNPLGLEVLESLRQMRARLHGLLPFTPTGDPESVQVTPRALAALCAEIPARYLPQTGACLFVQPADPGGRSWVLNRLFEGTGRYGSRYVHAMEEPLRERYLGHMVERSRGGSGPAGLPLLDLMYPRHNTVNLHPPQTEKVLGIPGEEPHLPPDRIVPLHELVVVRETERHGLRLTDSSGQPLLPVHLSSLGNAHLPPVLKFLSIFGPYEMRQVPPGSALAEDGQGHTPRLLLGRLVLQRRRWRLSAAEVPRASQAGDAAAYVEARRWATAAGLPERVFVAERLAAGNWKPLYVDFTSPVSVADFLALAGAVSGTLRIDEALPEPACYPRSGDVPRALELQIDEAMLNPATGESVPMSTAADWSSAPKAAVGGQTPAI